MSEQELPKDLVTVKEYVELRGLKAVQVVNGWCRNQGAPHYQVEKRRMVSIEELDDWAAEKDQRKAEGKGTDRAHAVQRSTGVKKGTMMVHNSYVGAVVTHVSKIGEHLVWAETAHKRGLFNAIPFTWDSLEKVIREKDVALVNPEIVVDLLISHFEGEEKTEEIELLQQLALVISPKRGDENAEKAAPEDASDSEDGDKSGEE